MFQGGVGRCSRTLNVLRTDLTQSHVQPGRRLLHASPARVAPVTFWKPQAETTSLESVATCPDPTCECAKTPEIQPPVDVKTRLKETAAGYSAQVVIATGKSDWTSKIEDDVPLAASSDPAVPSVSLTKALKKELGRARGFFDPPKPVLVTNSSFSPSGEDDHGESRGLAAYIFPAGIRVSGIPDTPIGHESFIRVFVKTETKIEPDAYHYDMVSGTRFEVEPVTSPTVLICSHMSRDVRCGVLGPLLYAEFKRHFHRLGVSTTSAASKDDDGMSGPMPWPKVNLAMCSHIGGHKWAGNVIIHMPKSSTIPSGLAGKSVWYGRVEPKHVEGIIDTTIMSGKVIAELSRGIRA